MKERSNPLMYVRGQRPIGIQTHVQRIVPKTQNCAYNTKRRSKENLSLRNSNPLNSSTGSPNSTPLPTSPIPPPPISITDPSNLTPIPTLQPLRPLPPSRSPWVKFPPQEKAHFYLKATLGEEEKMEEKQATREIQSPEKQISTMTREAGKGYENRWQQLSKRKLRILRHDRTLKPQEQMVQGWVRLSTLRSRGLQINEDRAYGLSVGEGGGRMARFQISRAWGRGETTIRLIQQDKRSRDYRGRKFTPTNG